MAWPDVPAEEESMSRGAQLGAVRRPRIPELLHTVGAGPSAGGGEYGGGPQLRAKCRPRVPDVLRDRLA